MQEDGDFKRTALSGSEIDQVTVVLPEVSRSLMTIMGNFPFNFCFIDYAKAFDCMDHNKLWKILKEMGIPDYLTCLLTNLYRVQEATEVDIEQQTGSKLGKEYIKAVYCHPAYLTYMQSASCKIPG